MIIELLLKKIKYTVRFIQMYIIFILERKIWEESMGNILLCKFKVTLIHCSKNNRNT